MSDEPWDADRIAAECAASAAAKTRKTARRKKGALPTPPVTSEEHDGDPPMRDPETFRDPETGRMLPGHPGLPGAGHPKGDTYEPRYADWVRKWAATGATVAEMCEWIGNISTSTFYRWRGEHPDFLDATKTGKAHADDRVQRSFYERATGYDYTEEQAIKVKIDRDTERIEIVTVTRHMPGDPLAAFKWLTNRRNDEWKDRRSVEHSGAIELPHPDQARRELAEWLSKGEVIEGTAVEVTPALAAPVPVEEPEADDF